MDIVAYSTIKSSKLRYYHATGALFNLPAVIVVAFITVILVIGIKESASLNAVIVFVKVAILFAFIITGGFFIKPELWHPFIPPNKGDFGVFGLSGVLRGAGVIFFAYIGFDTVSTLAQEAKNPQRDMPIGILGSLFICTVLYVIVSLVLTGVVPYTELNSPAPFAVALDAMKLHMFSPLLKLGTITPILGILTCLYLMLGLPRDTWIRLFVWLALGIVIYLSYGIKKSSKRKTA